MCDVEAKDARSAQRHYGRKPYQRSAVGSVNVLLVLPIPCFQMPGAAGSPARRRRIHPRQACGQRSAKVSDSDEEASHCARIETQPGYETVTARNRPICNSSLARTRVRRHNSNVSACGHGNEGTGSCEDEKDECSVSPLPA